MTLNSLRGTNLKYFPYVFTEQGVTMLSSVLHSDCAVQMNIAIMRAFVEMRRLAMLENDWKINLEKIKERSAEEIFKTSKISTSLELKYGVAISILSSR